MQDQEALRRDWMGLLAKAEETALTDLWLRAGMRAEFHWLREPECGSVMVRGRAGATGAPFNLGEMTVTRASLRLSTGEIGHAYVSGRSRQKAKIAALCDALLQCPADADRVETEILGPLRRAAARQREDRSAKAAATKVEFFTLQRGED